MPASRVETNILLPSAKERMLRYIASSVVMWPWWAASYSENTVAFDCMDHGFAVVVEDHQARLGHVA